MSQQLINLSTGSQYFYSSSNTPPGGVNQLLLFKSLHHLYYSGFNTGSGTIDFTSSYDNYIESSFTSGSRKMENLFVGDPNETIPTGSYLPTGSLVLFSIPRKHYGTHIEPGTLTLTSPSSSFWGGGTIIDDGEGNLITGSEHVGNIIYSHGQIIITLRPYTTHFIQNQSPDISFSSNVDIKTSTYNITIADYELNHTLNPTAQSGSTVINYSGSKYVQPSGVYSNNVTGSEFQPYITSVGLYNDADELIAVAKLSQPLPKPADTDLTIQVKLDV